MVEQEAVNFEVVGSSPTPGAKHKHFDKWCFFICYTLFMKLILKIIVIGALLFGLYYAGMLIVGFLSM
jgi:hypothetical protein